MSPKPTLTTKCPRCGQETLKWAEVTLNGVRKVRATCQCWRTGALIERDAPGSEPPHPKAEGEADA